MYFSHISLQHLTLYKAVPTLVVIVPLVHFSLLLKLHNQTWSPGQNILKVLKFQIFKFFHVFNNASVQF